MTQYGPICNCFSGHSVGASILAPPALDLTLQMKFLDPLLGDNDKQRWTVAKHWSQNRQIMQITVTTARIIVNAETFVLLSIPPSDYL